MSLTTSWVGFAFADATVFLLDVVQTVLGVVIKDVVGVCSGCILGEPDTTAHVGSEPDLVEEHRACCNDLKGMTVPGRWGTCGLTGPCRRSVRT